MGYYLNPEDVIDIYRREVRKPYFIDKTKMIDELIPLVERQGCYLSVTRPRRFGKSVVASMIGAFFGKGVDSGEVFSQLEISQNQNYRNHLNQHNLIYIDFSRDVADCGSYTQYITTIKNRLTRDLKTAYPDAEIDRQDSMGLFCALFRSLIRTKNLYWFSMNGIMFSTVIILLRKTGEDLPLFSEI